MNRKKGFTLIELLSVVVILAIIFLIATPIILNVVEDARIASEKRSIEGIIKSAKLYYSESLLSDDLPEKKVFYYGINQTDKLEVSGKLPDSGELTIESDGQISLNLIYGNRCYVKEYNENEISLSDSDKCFTISEPSLYEKPTISFELLSEINEYDWIKDKLEVKINTQSNSIFQVESFTYCVNNEGNACTPDKTIEKSNDILTIETSGNNIICGYATDKANNGETICSDIYNLDNINPTLGEININGTSVNNEWYLSPVEITYIDGTDELSGHEYTKADVLINDEIQEEKITYYDEDTMGVDLLVTTSDKAGNVLTNTKVLKIDQELPEILGLDKLIVGIDEEVDFFESLEYVDEISGVDKVTASINNVSELGLGEHIITYTIIDKAGNQAQYQRTILVLNKEPNITFRATGINSRGWAKNDISLKMTGKKNSAGSKVESYTWCSSTDGECTPNTTVAATKTTTRYVNIKLTEEGKNNICVYVTYEDQSVSETVCTENNYGITYNIDKTAPNPGEIIILSGTMGNDDWYISSVTSTYTDGTDTLSGHYKTTISGNNKTANSKATKITVTTTDNAGNVAKNIKTIKIDKTNPTLSNLTKIKIEEGEAYPLLEKVRSYDYMSGVKSVTMEPSTTEILPIGENTIKYIVTDNAGNSKEYTRKVTVVEVKPSIEYTSSIPMNEYGYTNRNFFVTMKANSTLHKDASKIVWCSTMTQESCIPKKEVELSNNEVSIIQDGTTIVCANVIYEDGSESDVVCSSEYKKDTIKPSLGKVTIEGTKTDSGWYTSDVTILIEDGLDDLSGHLETTLSIKSITEDTTGIDVVATTIDKAGNNVSETINIKVDKTSPTVIPVNSYANTIITMSDNASGLLKYCINQDPDPTSCISYITINGTSKEIIHTANETGTYYVHVYDVVGHVTSKSFAVTQLIKGYNAYEIGDAVTLLDGTVWYVIEESPSSQSTVTLFAEQNLTSSGTGWTMSTLGTEIGVAFDTKNNRNKSTSTYCASASNYGCNVYEKVSGTYTNGTKSGTVINDSTIKVFLNGTVKNYIDNSLKSVGGTEINSIRLITVQEICNIVNSKYSSSNPCSFSSSLDLTEYANSPIWLYSTRYWTMTPKESNVTSVYEMRTSGSIGTGYAYSASYAAARPVVVVDKSNIKVNSYSIGDAVSLKDGTTWYVIKDSPASESTITLFAEQNVNTSGTAWTTKLDEYKKPFDTVGNRNSSTSTYCEKAADNGCNAYEAVSGTYTNGTKSGTVIHDSSIKIFLNGTVKNFINKSLTASGGTEINSIRLITANEVCDVINSKYPNSNPCVLDLTSNTAENIEDHDNAPYWLMTTEYLTMTPKTNNSYNIFEVREGTYWTIYSVSAKNETSGARPVIVTDKTNIR